jgi:hypothetical protein
MVMNWKFFVGATILACGLLFKFGAPVMPVGAGVAAAALMNWKMNQRRPG